MHREKQKVGIPMQKEVKNKQKSEPKCIGKSQKWESLCKKEAKGSKRNQTEARKMQFK